MKTELEFGASLQDPHIVPTRYWHRLDNGKLQCDLCPRACQLNDHQRGLCFIRARLDDQIVMTSYGRASGFCVDPIEKKPLNHFYPGSSVLSFGTAGCNLACKFCQNWDISKSREMDRLMDQASPEAIVKKALALGCKSVAFTYNDPVIFHEYVVDVARYARQRGLSTVAVTAGYICEKPRKEFFKDIDAVNVDLKAFTENFYKRFTGSSLQSVLDTLVYLKNATHCWFEITTLLIPGLNDSDEEIKRMSAWIFQYLGPDVPLHFSAFHPDYKMMDYPPTPPATLTRAREIAIGEGLHYVYTGNVHDSEGGSSYCSGCGERVIDRDWYLIRDYKITGQGCCQHCGEQLPGKFESDVGDWGPKRMVVRIG